MATDTLIGYGKLPLEVLERMYDSFPDGLMYEESDPATVIAALLWLDEYYKVHQDGDRVVIHPAIGGWLLMQWPVEGLPQVAELVAKYNDETQDEIVVDAVLAELSTVWFQMIFRSDGVSQCHPILEGRTVTMRFMTADEVEATDATCLTVREADGSIIELTNLDQPKFP